MSHNFSFNVYGNFYCNSKCEIHISEDLGYLRVIKKYYILTFLCKGWGQSFLNESSFIRYLLFVYCVNATQLSSCHSWCKSYSNYPLNW